MQGVIDLLRTFIFGNLQAKSMALIMAVVLWFYAINKYTGEIMENIQIAINTPPGITILDTSSNVVTISLSGPRNVIDRVSDMIKDNKIEARYDFTDMNDIHNDEFTKTIRLSRRNFNLPQEVRLDSMVPNEIDVVLGRLASKYLQVQIERKGIPAPGYEITNEYFYPHEVLVIGPANVLKEAEVINTKPTDINGITSDQNRTFPWAVDLEQSISFLKDDKYVTAPINCEEKIKVWFQVSQKKDIKIFENFKVKLKEEYIALNLEGSKLMLDRLNSKDITAYIDVSSLTPPGPYKQPVNCNIPEGLEIEGNLPEVHIDIVEATTETR
jgi:YbbR domain-containing protein